VSGGGGGGSGSGSGRGGGSGSGVTSEDGRELWSTESVGGNEDMFGGSGGKCNSVALAAVRSMRELLTSLAAAESMLRPAAESDRSVRRARELLLQSSAASLDRFVAATQNRAPSIIPPSLDTIEDQLASFEQVLAASSAAALHNPTHTSRDTSKPLYWSMPHERVSAMARVSAAAAAGSRPVFEEPATKRGPVLSTDGDGDDVESLPELNDTPSLAAHAPSPGIPFATPSSSSSSSSSASSASSAAAAAPHALFE
jgi:hypothetical protein